MTNKMRVTTKQIVDAQEALRIQGERDDLVALVEYRLAYLVEQLNPIGKAYQKARNRLLRDNALRTADGDFAWGGDKVGTYQVDPTKMDQYDEAIDKLHAETHEIFWAPLPAKALENKRGVIPGGALAINGLRPFLDLTGLQKEMEKAIKDEEEEARGKRPE